MKHSIYNGIENLTKKEIVKGRAAEKKNDVTSLDRKALEDLLLDVYGQLLAMVL